MAGRAFAITTGLALALAACGDRNDGGLTTEEERQLDEAARMVEDNVVDLPADSLVANEAELEAMDEPAEAGAGEAVENVQ